MMIYLHSYYLKSLSWHYHDFYNPIDNTYYSITVNEYCISYFKGVITSNNENEIDFHGCEIFQYTLPDIIKLIDNDNIYDTPRLQHLENSKLDIIVNNI